ncbi:Malonate transporter MadL subunit, partial [Pseudomonas syringae pv. aceris]
RAPVDGKTRRHEQGLRNGRGFLGRAVHPGGGGDGCATECRHRAQRRACCRSGRRRFGGVVCLHHCFDQPYQPGRAIAQGRAAADA